MPVKRKRGCANIKRMNALQSLLFELEIASDDGVVTNNKEAYAFTVGFIAGMQKQRNEDFSHLTESDIEVLKNEGREYFKPAN